MTRFGNKPAQYYVKTRVKGPRPSGSLARRKRVWGSWQMVESYPTYKEASEKLDSMDRRLWVQSAIFYRGKRVKIIGL